MKLEYKVVKMIEAIRKASNIEVTKLIQDQDLQFYSRSRRNTCLGLWAAARLNLRARSWDFASYIRDLGVMEPDDNKFVRLVRGEMVRRGLRTSESEIRAELERQAAVEDQELRSYRTHR